MAGAFCVFGVSKSEIKKSVDKKLNFIMVKDVGTGGMRPETNDEWYRRRDEVVDMLFNSTEAIKQISPEFDAPQFAIDWIAAGPQNVKLTKIMCRSEKVDAHGNKIKGKSGAPIMTWREYDMETGKLAVPLAKIKTKAAKRKHS